MRKLMNKIDRFCYAHPRFGIPNLMLIIVKGNGQFTLHRPDSDDEKFTSIEHLLNAVSSAMSKLRLSILAAEEAEDATVAEKIVEKNAGLEETAEQ